MSPLTDVHDRYQAALAEAQWFFMGEANVQAAARTLAARLTELGIPYAICGGLAVAAHGHVRVTADVDVLLTPDGLRRFKERWLGRGWTERFPGSKRLEDAVHGVKVNVLLSGDFPGDGKPKPVAFPDPALVAEVRGETAILTLEVLVELKLASGQSAAHRLQDLADVIALIRANALPRDWSSRLDASVRAKYVELWEAAQQGSDEED